MSDLPPDVQKVAQDMRRVRDERRLALGEIPYSWALWLVQAGIQAASGAGIEKGSAIRLPSCSVRLPADVFVVGIQWAQDRDSWIVAMASREWEPVPDGESPPFVAGPRDWVVCHAIQIMRTEPTELDAERCEP